jgi:hypothetical protein
MEHLFKIGGWTYHPERLLVTYRAKGAYEYDVDLESCTTSAEMLDWIVQFSKKTWATSEAVGDLVKILNKLLRPQGTLCSFGVESGPLPMGDAMRELIANHIGEKETFNQWQQSRTKTTSDTIVTPEVWQELLLMERNAK